MHKVFKEFHQVCIREWTVADVETYASIVGDPGVMRFIGNGSTRDFDAAAREVERFQNAIEQQGWSRWAVSIGEDGPLIGYAGFAEKSYGIDFGMRFHPEHWGKPSTYISCCLALEYGFEDAGLEEVCTITDVEHVRGLSFMRKLFSSDPIDTTLDFGHFKMYQVTKDGYLSYDKANNRARMELGVQAELGAPLRKPADWNLRVPRLGDVSLGW